MVDCHPSALSRLGQLHGRKQWFKGILEMIAPYYGKSGRGQESSRIILCKKIDMVHENNKECFVS
jgi:hypothetical protein